MTEDADVKAGLPRIQHRTKAELAYEYLREQIINGTYAPGQRMTLAEVAADLGLSFMPIREAMLRLERETLLISEPHKGMRVVPLSLTAAQELFEIRRELEGLAAWRACSAGDPGLVPDLERMNAEFARARTIADFSAMGVANWAFHRRILHTAASSQLARMLEDVWTGSLRYRLGYQLIPDRAALTVAEHAEIIAAIAAENPQAAREAAREHIRRAGAALAAIVTPSEGP